MTILMFWNKHLYIYLLISYFLDMISSKVFKAMGIKKSQNLLVKCRPAKHAGTQPFRPISSSRVQNSAAASTRAFMRDEL